MFLSSYVENFRLIVVVPCIFMAQATDGLEKCGYNFDGVVHRCCFWNVTVCWLEHFVDQDSVPAC